MRSLIPLSVVALAAAANAQRLYSSASGATATPTSSAETTTPSGYTDCVRDSFYYNEVPHRSDLMIFSFPMDSILTVMASSIVPLLMGQKLRAINIRMVIGTAKLVTVMLQGHMVILRKDIATA